MQMHGLGEQEFGAPEGEMFLDCFYVCFIVIVVYFGDSVPWQKKDAKFV